MKEWIELYCLHVQEYIKQIVFQINEEYIQKRMPQLCHGCTMLIHILSITYAFSQDLNLCHEKLTHSRLLILEFICQMDHHREHLSNPIHFVCSKVLNDVSLQHAKSSLSIPFQQMKQYTVFVLAWKNPHIVMNQRLYLANVFLQPYLMFFCQSLPPSTSIDSFPLMEYIYEKCQVDSDAKHYEVLNELFKQVSSSPFQKKMQNLPCFHFLHPSCEESSSSTIPLQKRIQYLIQSCTTVSE